MHISLTAEPTGRIKHTVESGLHNSDPTLLTLNEDV